MKKIIGFGIAAAAALSLASVAPQAHAATQDTVGINATVAPVLNLTIEESSVEFNFDNVAENADDVKADSINGNVQSNIPATVSVRAEAAGTGKLNPSDITLDGEELSSSEDLEVFGVSHSSLQDGPFSLTVGVNNADDYKGGATYSNTLTFTAVPAS